MICVYIDETHAELRRRGGATDWWLDKSLADLQRRIEALGGQLVLRRGDAHDCLKAIIAETGARAVYWNRRYGAVEQTIDTEIKTSLKAQGLEVESFLAHLLTEPWQLKTKTGGYYRVFTPYWKALRASYTPPDALPAPTQFTPTPSVKSEVLDAWGLHPKAPDWSQGFTPVWQPGETGAHDRLEQF